MATDNIYPSGALPKPTGKYSLEKGDGSVSTKFASGKVRRRNIHDDKRRVVNLQMEFSQRQLDLFSAWYDRTLNNGAENFTVDLLLDADDYQNYEVTPLSGFKATHSQVKDFKVTWKVLALDQKYMSAEVIELIIFSGGTIEELLLADDALDLHINTTLGDYFAE